MLIKIPAQNIIAFIENSPYGKYARKMGLLYEFLIGKELQQIVDMPDKELDLMMMFRHQNKGIFPKRRRDQFIKLTDAEIRNMQSAFRKVFELDILDL